LTNGWPQAQTIIETLVLPSSLTADDQRLLTVSRDLYVAADPAGALPSPRIKRTVAMDFRAALLEF
jgi:hypothetical protein